jgi:hypothetical protein
VIELIEQHPELKELEGFFVARHRAGLFKSFLENMDDKGLIYSTAQGFTNTYRMQHSKPIANLPGVDKFYGKEVRGCIAVPDESYEMVGSDISGLEDNTKQHYMYFYDPDYVNEMRIPGFDPHIDIAVFAGLMTEEQADRFKELNSRENLNPEEKTEFKALKLIRGNAKVVNFSGVYGAGPPKMAETLKSDLAFAEKLHTAYWKRNSSVKKVAKNCKVVKVRNQAWLYNPVSGLWMFLKEDKDRFSTLNQSTGVYVFDTWMKYVRRRLNPMGIKILLQYHDELLIQYKKEFKTVVAMHLKEAMIEANEELQLNVKIEISSNFGKNYAECH